MPATLLSSPALATCRPSGQRFCRTARVAPARASYRSGFGGFDANRAFRQAAEQFAQFQKQQAHQQSQNARRNTAGRTEAFRGAYGPFAWNFDADQVNRFMRDMDRAFGGDGSSVPTADDMKEAATCLYFPADMRESKTEYKYILDLPGVPKSDIKVQVDKDRKLTVSGERKKEELGESWKQQRRERRFGAFQRKFQLPEDADVNKIQGKSESGVLTITIRKVPKEDVPSDSTSIPIY